MSCAKGFSGPHWTGQTSSPYIIHKWILWVGCVSGPLPPLNTLRVFDAVVRHLSFTKAAEELGMTQAAVSYQIKQLEARVGTSMFRRLTRGLALTDAGARLAPAVADAFARLKDAFSSIRDDGTGILSVTAVGTFTGNWLVPRIGRFQMAWPNIAVRLETSTRLVDFAREEFDVGVRGGTDSRASWPGLASEELISVDLVPMCSPRLIGGAGRLSSPRDLLGLPLLGEMNVVQPQRGAAQDWRAWCLAAGLSPDQLPTFRAEFTTQSLSGAAAIAGQGVALLTPAFFRNELQSGILVQPLDIILRGVERYYFVCLEGRRNVPKIKAFRDWLFAELARDEADNIVNRFNAN